MSASNPSVAVASGAARPVVPPTSSRSLPLRGLTIALPMFTTWCVCFFRIGTSQLWRDEGATWWAATLPWEDFIRLLHHRDAVLAPYYVVLRICTRVFGDSEAALRAPSAIAMGLCAGLVALLGRRVFDDRIGLRAGLIFALFPMVSRYGQEARPYAFVTLFAALSSLLVLRLREKPTSFPRAAAYAATVAAVGLSHLVALLLLLSHAACFVRITRAKPHLRIDRRPFTRFALAAFVGTALVLPLTVVGAGQSAQLHAIVLSELKPKLSLMLGVKAMGALMIALFLGRALFSRRQNVMLQLWAALPPFLLLVTYPTFHIFRPRYVLFTLPAWALLVACSIEPKEANARLRAWVTPLTALALVLLGWNVQIATRRPNARVDSDYRAAAQDLALQALPGDALAFGGTHGRLEHARLALAYELRHGPVLEDVFVERSMREQGLFSARECDDPGACLPSDVTRLWLVTSAPSSELYAGIPPAREHLLEDAFEVSEVRSHWNVTVALLTRRSVARP